MILVIGATGTVGRPLVSRLLQGGHPVRAFTRDASRLTPAPGLEVAEGDLDRPETLAAALDGVRAVFVLSAGPDALAQELTAAELVAAAGVHRVVKLSSVAAIEPAAGCYGVDHAKAEAAFAAAVPEFTALRPSGFMTNILQWQSTIAASGTVYQCHGEIPRAVVAPADVAEAAAVCLTRPGLHGRPYQLTGPEALTSPQLVARVSAALGRPLRYVETVPRDAVAGMIGAGLPPHFAQGLLDALAAPEPARGGRPTLAVRHLTGHPATSFDTWLTRNLTAFRTLPAPLTL
jgi:uncharacterized protein YbjT (DUF2867 family)